MKLYFVRHGESEANILREFSNTGTKHPLTTRGVEQALQLSRNLSGLKVDYLYSSPVLRAQQTAMILGQAWGVDVQITEALREWDVGIYEGTRGEDGWAIHHQVIEDWMIHHKWESKMQGGESHLDIRARFIPFINGLAQEFASTTSIIVLVGHGGLYQAMLPVIFDNIPFEQVYQTSFPNTAYALGEIRSGRLHCLEWCGKIMDQDAVY